MGRHPRVNLGGETIVLMKTRAEVLADRAINEQDRLVYLAMLDLAEAQSDPLHPDITHEAAIIAMEHRKRRPKLEKLKRRR